MPKTDPKIPCNPEAERVLLGAMLTEKENAMKALSLLSGDEFFTDTNRVVYRSMQTLAGESKPIDMVTVVDVLTRTQLITRGGGPAYISSLVDGVPRVVNMESYAKMISNTYKLRRLLHFTDDVKTLIDGKGDVDEVVELAVQKLLEISSTGSGGPLIREWRTVGEQAVKDIQEEHDFPEKAARINTGIEELDIATNGLRRKELVVIVGPTSHGKTLLAQQIMDYAETQGYRGLFFSGEMPGEQIVIRQLAYDAGLDFWKVRYPEKMKDEEIDALREVAKVERNVTIIENDISPMNIWALTETYKRSTRGLDFIIVDYDQLVIEAGIDPDEDEDDFFRHQRKFMFQAKKIAERLEVCFILLSQLRKVRNQKGRQPTVDDIYGDSSIRNTPHMILWVVRHFFLHDFKPEFERKASVYLIKSRNGRTCKVDLTFDQGRVRFLEAEPSEGDSVPVKKTKGSFEVVDDTPF